MVLYEYDGNSILAEPIKNRTSAELLRAFQVMENILTARGLQPKLMRLDNEASYYSSHICMTRISLSNWYHHTVTGQTQ
jgi:hypothetical protein